MNFFQSVFDSINKDLREFEKDFQKFFDTLDDRQPERWRPNFWHFLWKWERRGLKMPDESRWAIEDLLRDLAPEGWVEDYYGAALRKIDQQEAANRLNAAPKG